LNLVNSKKKIIIPTQPIPPKPQSSPPPTTPPRSLQDEMITGLKKEQIQNNKLDNISILPISNKTVLKALEEGEDGDAYLLIKLLKDRYVFDHSAGEWFYWNDNFWRLDKINHVTTLIKEVIDLYGTQKIYEILALQNAGSEKDEDAQKKHEYLIKSLETRIQSLRTLTRKKEVLRLACSGLNSLAITGENWDNHPMLLACRNGCIDLKKGEFRDGIPGDYIKTVSPIKWESYKTPCPIWKEFLSQMLSNNQDIVDYVQRLLGYGITGLNTEHIFPIFWGSEGRNGKGTLFETLKYVLGDFAYKAPANFLMEQNFKTSGASPDAVKIGLRGKRIVWCSETNEKDRLDVANLKELVGGDTLSARAPYARRQVEFTPSHLLLIILNKRPKVPANDRPLWERLHLIPLENSFVDNPDPKKPHEFKADKRLLSKLKKEAPGILAWLVAGCLLWQKYGISPPNIINAATEEYRQNEDILGDFIKECCFEDDNPMLRITTKDFYAAYKKWCDEVGHYPMSKKRFLEDMRVRFEYLKSDGQRYFINVGLVLEA